jgi:hypothetical protein
LTPRSSEGVVPPRYDAVMSNPSVIPADTSVEAWRILRTAVRQLTPEQRVAQWESLNRSISEMQSESIRRANPSMNDLLTQVTQLEN